MLVIAALVQRVISQAPAGTRLSQQSPVFGKLTNRPSPEAQMQAIRQVAPQIESEPFLLFPRTSVRQQRKSR